MMVSFQNVVRCFGGHAAVDGVSLDLGGDERVVVFVGPSGGGKSTLLRLAGGLEKADSGHMVFDGVTLGPGDKELLDHRRQNGFVFQAFNLFLHLSALENIALPLTEVHGLSRAEAETRARECLERFDLAAHEYKLPSQLSGGQQQRVGIARAIASRPRLLILDEPTSALDPEMTAEVLEVIRELADGGQDILLSTHEMGFAQSVADRVVFLAGGRVVEQGSPGKVIGEPESETVRRFFSKVMRY